MQSLFRYLSDEYIDAFVRRGEVFFRALSYYRDYEDADVRSDTFEGTRVHLPIDGLKATVVGTAEVVSLPYTFESTAREDDIFVYCLSTERSEELAEKFNIFCLILILIFPVDCSHVSSAPSHSLNLHLTLSS